MAFLRRFSNFNYKYVLGAVGIARLHLPRDGCDQLSAATCSPDFLSNVLKEREKNAKAAASRIEKGEQPPTTNLSNLVKGEDKVMDQKSLERALLEHMAQLAIVEKASSTIEDAVLKFLANEYKLSVDEIKKEPQYQDRINQLIKETIDELEKMGHGSLGYKLNKHTVPVTSAPLKTKISFKDNEALFFSMLLFNSLECKRDAYITDIPVKRIRFGYPQGLHWASEEPYNKLPDCLHPIDAINFLKIEFGIRWFDTECQRKGWNLKSIIKDENTEQAMELLANVPCYVDIVPPGAPVISSVGFAAARSFYGSSELLGYPDKNKKLERINVIEQGIPRKQKTFCKIDPTAKRCELSKLGIEHTRSYSLNDSAFYTNNEKLPEKEWHPKL